MHMRDVDEYKYGGGLLVNSPVLVLNQNYSPLNICRVRRALVLVMHGKAEVVENGRGFLRSIGVEFDIPSVIRLVYYIRRPHLPRKMTKLEIFNRDHYTCQYCGWHGKELTLDHVVPKKRGGEHTWENVVSACALCNRKKAGRTPLEAGMPLKKSPEAPGNDGFYIPYTHLSLHNEWKKYLRQ
jgi:5-methylcytosine-specific restriction endonuclease McrA